MKPYKPIIIAAALFAAVACNSGDTEMTPEEQAWTTLSEWSSKHSDFDPKSIPDKLVAMDMSIILEEYLCRGGNLCQSRHGRDGWSAIGVTFYSDGTCRMDYTRQTDCHYAMFTWHYDESTSVITTEYCGEHPNFRSPMQAQVKAVGDGRIVLDGNLCGSANIYGPVEETGGYGFYPDYGYYVRMVVTPASDEWRERRKNAACDNPL